MAARSRRRSAAAGLLRLWIRIPPEAWTSVCCEWCVLSGCGELITRPEEFYWLWCVGVCDLETLWMRRPWPTWGCCAKRTRSTFTKAIIRTTPWMLVCCSWRCFKCVLQFLCFTEWWCELLRLYSVESWQRYKDYEQWCNHSDVEKPKYPNRNLSYCHLVHHISHMDYTEIEPGPPWRQFENNMRRKFYENLLKYLATFLM